MTTKNPLNYSVIASYLLAALSLPLIINKGLLAALFAGLLVYSLVHLVSPILAKKINSNRAKVVAVAALGTLIITLLSLAIWSSIAYFQSDAGSVHVLLQKLADIIEASRNQIPVWMREHLPDNADALRELLTDWLREHAIEAKSIGQEAGRTLAHILLGMIIGAMVALHDTTSTEDYLPFAAALRDRLTKLSDSFQRIVFAQVRIAGINAVLTALYILIILPIAGIHLPLSKSLIAITFFAGLIPVVGNIVSNSVLVVVALSHSLNMALVSLLYMIVIHKLEYFLNAKIIGAQIQARAWELLVAILVMESMFGLSGLIAAPVFYAYLKKELMDLGLV